MMLVNGYLIFSSISILAYLMQRLRLLPNAKIEEQTFGKVFEKVRSLSVLANIIYISKFLVTLTFVGFTGIFFAEVIGGILGFFTDSLPIGNVIPDVDIFSVEVGIINITLAAAAGVWGPDKSFKKLSKRVSKMEEQQKEIWLTQQRERLQAPVDISHENRDNEDINNHNQ